MKKHECDGHIQEGDTEAEIGQDLQCRKYL